ncbi:MAG TPA: ABC transporter ATP-binding protein [Gemmatimonadales bacterium]|nr:ABC transporter ATP-binding protein [Gemmatimonadales bacterium]
MSFAVETAGLRYSPGSGFELHALDLHIPRGTIYGFLGPNGSGKTTTIRLILGLLRPLAGRITVLDRTIPDHSSQVLARIGYVPEAPHFDPTLTVREILRFQAAFYPSWDHAWAENLLAQFELDDRKPFGALSKGQKAKLMMLTVLAERPELLILDEPTDGLDPVARRDILAALLEYVTTGTASVLISSHLVHELERICGWVGVMDQGRLVTESSMERLKDGMKRLTIANAPTELPEAPFRLLSRKSVDGTETWTVRDWEPAMTRWFPEHSIELRRVVDLDLEEGFVELLRAFRVERQLGAL